MSHSKLLPNWLYLPSSSNASTGIPPTAVLRPAQAVASGNAWQSASQPRMQAQKKKIIFDEEILNYYSKIQVTALIHLLLQEGFEIYLWSEGGLLPEFKISSPDLFIDFYKMIPFNPRIDYETCAKAGFSRDAILVLEGEKSIDLFKYIHRWELTYDASVCASDFSLSVGTSNHPQRWSEPDFIQHVETYSDSVLPFFLNRPDYSLDFAKFLIRNYGGEGLRQLIQNKWLRVISLIPLAINYLEFAIFLSKQPKLLEIIPASDLIRIAESHPEFARFFKLNPQWLKDIKQPDKDRMLCLDDEFIATLMEEPKLFDSAPLDELIVIAQAQPEFVKFLIKTQPEKLEALGFHALRRCPYKLCNIVRTQPEFAEYLISQIERLHSAVLILLSETRPEFAEYLVKNRPDLLYQLDGIQLASLVNQYPSIEDLAIQIAKDHLSLSDYLVQRSVDSVKTALEFGSTSFCTYSTFTEQTRKIAQYSELECFRSPPPFTVKPLLLELRDILCLEALLQRLTEAEKYELFSELRFIEVAPSAYPNSTYEDSILKKLNEIISYAPQLECIELPSGQGSSIHFETIVVTQSNNAFLERYDYVDWTALQNSEYYYRSQAEDASRAPTQGLIYMNFDSCKDLAYDNISAGHNFKMLPIGRGLNSLKPVSVRRSLLSFQLVQSRQTHLSLKPIELLPQMYTKCSFSRLSLEEIHAYARENSSNIEYYQMNQVIPADGEFHRLYSIHPSETLAGFLGNPDEPSVLELVRGDDDFYYARNFSTAPIESSYVLKLSTKAHRSDLDNLPLDHPARPIIEEYLANPLFQLIADPTRSITPLVIQKGESAATAFHSWMRSLYLKAEGVCWQRALAVARRIKNNVRLIQLNGTHVALELKLADGNWILLDVLGGGKITQSYQKAENLFPPLPQPPFLCTPSVPQEKKQLILSSALKLKIIHSEVELLKTLDSDKRNLLFVSSKLEEETLRLASACHQALSRPLFIIAKPSDLEIGKAALILKKSEGSSELVPDINSEGGALLQFLAEARAHPEQTFSLLIHWDAFTPQERLALNTLLDPLPSLMGAPLSDNVQILGLCREMPKDPSFRSRHQGEIYPLDLPAKTVIPTEPEPSKPRLDIDLEGSEHWQEKLLGRITLIDNEMVFDADVFLSESLEGKVVSLLNVPESQKKSIEQAFALAMAQGYFLYHGHKIEIPPSFHLSLSNQALSFSHFQADVVTFEVPLENQAPDSLFVNTYWFDLLLQDKRVLDGQYREVPGAIAQHANAELSLHIAGDLTESQWYRLFNQAQKHNVHLNLSLTSQVSLPKDVKVLRSLEYEEMKAEESFSESKTHEAQEDDFPFVFDIEDHSFSDLFYSITFEQSENRFSNFDYRFGPVLLSLLAGKDVILKGSFSQELLGYLAPLCVPGCHSINLNGQIIPFSGQLKIAAPLPLCEPLVVYQETDLSKEPFESAEEADAFVTARQTALLNSLQSSALARLMGSTGVGKSSLMRELARTGVSVYRELEALDSWANDSSKQIKILFIDEHNIENLHFTFLAPLLKGGKPCIAYHGQLYELDEYHKVVFAGNDETYGGGRVEQNLFKHYSIPHLILENFPPCYIYHRILKPIFDRVSGLNPLQVHEKAQKLIQTGGMTVRGLQQEALDFCSSCLLSQENQDQYFNPPADSDFFVAPYIEKANAALLQALLIKDQQRSGMLPGHGWGLNGVLIEGKPGIGKTEMIRHCLEISGSPYIKIDANASFEKKKEQLLKGFHEGIPVWIDELNACCDDGLEKVLNSLLTGVDLKEAPAKNPGFMLIGSVNGIDLEGRSALSPALQDRCVRCTVNLPQENDIKQILEHTYPDLSQDIIETIASEYVALQRNENYNLRDLMSSLKEKFKPLASPLTFYPSFEDEKKSNSNTDELPSPRGA